MNKFNAAGKLKHMLEDAAVAIGNANSNGRGVKDGGITDDVAGTAVSALRFTSNRVVSAAGKLRGNKGNKAYQKRNQKKSHAKSYRGAAVKKKKRAQEADEVRRKIQNALTAMAKSVRRNMIPIFIVLVIALILAGLILGVGSCASFFGGGSGIILLTSYTAEDEDIIGADEDYEALERELADTVANIEADYPGYDEYQYFLDDIGHDPYVLASYLTVRFADYTREAVQSALQQLFGLQYELVLIPIVEIRTRTETRTRIVTVIDEETGEETEAEEEYEVEAEYEYHIMEVTLTNTSLGRVVTPLLSFGELEMYAVYMETQGNRPELFENHLYASRREYLDYEIPPEALDDEVFAALIAEAEKFLGYPYVWGGSHPSTSFDCSGFVSWVINQCGWNVGRLNARGLSSICASVSSADAKPGDLVFFNYTYAAPEPHLPTHVGIYVGNNMMIHAGNPISYARIDTKYYAEHFYGFGRLPGN